MNDLNWAIEARYLQSLLRSVRLRQAVDWSEDQLTAPTLFDALQAARGVTPFSQLDSVQITRKGLHRRGRKVQTKVNFLRLISDGDGTSTYGSTTVMRSSCRSKDVLRDQLLAASRTNLP